MAEIDEVISETLRDATQYESNAQYLEFIGAEEILRNRSLEKAARAREVVSWLSDYKRFLDVQSWIADGREMVHICGGCGQKFPFADPDGICVFSYCPSCGRKMKGVLNGRQVCSENSKKV